MGKVELCLPKEGGVRKTMTIKMCILLKNILKDSSMCQLALKVVFFLVCSVSETRVLQSRTFMLISCF